MRDMTLMYESLAILEKKYQDMAARMRTIEQQRAEDRERLNAHGMLLAPPSRRDVVRHYEAQLAQIKPARREFLSGGVTCYLPPEAA